PERPRLAGFPGDHLQLPTFTWGAGLQVLCELVHRLELARRELAAVALGEAALEVGVADVPREPARDEHDQPVVGALLRAHGHRPSAGHRRRRAAPSDA